MATADARHTPGAAPAIGAAPQADTPPATDAQPTPGTAPTARIPPTADVPPAAHALSGAWTLAAGEGRTRVQVTGFSCGPDLVLAITGGTHPHVGAVSLASPRPSRADPTRRSATASVLTVLGHQEDELARWAALEAARVTGGHAVVAAGIHIDAATPAEVAALVETARELVRQWLARWASPPAPPAGAPEGPGPAGEGEAAGPGAY